jgi:hypothetical protein
MHVYRLRAHHAALGFPPENARPAVAGWALLIGLVFFFYSMTVHAAHPEGGQELVLFGSVEASHFDGDQSPSSNDGVATVDLLYSLSHSQFRLLGEYILSTEEAELERFQIGWLPHETTWLIAGRFHAPTNFWASIYHHGQYMQTTIVRPSIENWEDDYGVLLSHQTGIMLESNFSLGQGSGLEIAASFGSGAEIDNGMLEPYHLLGSEGIAGASFSARIGFLPDALANNSLGMLVARNQLVSSNSQVIMPELMDVDQDIIGGFFNWTWDSLRVLSAAYHVQNQLVSSGGSESDNFTAGYVQLEKTIADWTLYGRWEDTAGAETSEYLSLFPEYVTQRSLVGVRLDFLKRHALTLELFDAEVEAEGFWQVAIQWSAVFR